MRALFICMVLVAVGCDETRQTSDSIQREQQEKLTAEAASQTGMPSIKNFRERKMLKEILELRDQTGLTTYTYLYSEFSGKLIYFGETIGYGIPYATQYTNPQRPARRNETFEQGNLALPQADPNGLFSPTSAEGTWVLLKDPNGKDVKPVYVEPRIVVSPFKLAGVTH